MNLACRLLCVVVALLPYPAARAANFDLVVGPSFDSGRPTPAAFFSIFGETPRDGHFHFTPIGSAGWIHPRTDHYSNLGRPDNFNHPVFLVAGGVRIVIPDPHWFVSEQIAATSARTDPLSSLFEFMTSIGWQNGHFIMLIRHVSNAHWVGGGRNLGETMILAGVRW